MSTKICRPYPRTKIAILASLLTIPFLLLSLRHVSASASSSLSSEELAFVAAIGTGAYSYDQNTILALTMGSMGDGLGNTFWRGTGSAADHQAAQYIKSEMEAIGLKNVALEPFPVHAYDFHGASVHVLAPTPGDPMLAAGWGGVPGTGPDGITAELVYVGSGLRADYEGKNVEGKLALVENVSANGWSQWPQYEAELHGAVGLVLTMAGYQNYPNSVTTHDGEARPTLPMVDVSHENAAYLKSLCLAGPVTVKMIDNATVDFDGVAHNVVGYIPGTTHPDELIIIADHYDKWWYGAGDDSSGVANVLAIAKALIDSGYQPSRTLVFVAHSAEEYGWTNTNDDWCIGAWNQINRNHPEWAGKTIAYFNFEGGGAYNGTTVSLRGTPETYSFILSLKSLVDPFFSATLPWSAYYTPSTTSYALASNMTDAYSYTIAGIPTMAHGAPSRHLPSNQTYHTQFDSINFISAEILAMTGITNGIAVIRMDRSSVLPYDFTHWVPLLNSRLDRTAIANAGLSTKLLDAKIDAFNNAAAGEWSAFTSDPTGGKDVNAINAQLLETAKRLESAPTYRSTSFIFQTYQTDTTKLRDTINALKADDVDTALASLSGVAGMNMAVKYSYEVYKEMQLDRNSDSWPNLFWNKGRNPHYTNAYAEYFSLLAKKAANDHDYTAELASLGPKYQTAVDNLSGALHEVILALEESTRLLTAVK